MNMDLSRHLIVNSTRLTRQNPIVTDEVVYLSADEEDKYIVAQANEQLDEDGHFVRNNVSGRFREETSEFAKSKIDLMDVSPKMVFSVATAMIPFLPER